MQNQHSTDDHQKHIVMGVASFLILHGIANHRPPDHWQFWLAARLAEKGPAVAYPMLPDPDAPSLRAWQATLHDHLAALEGAERVVICHSLACLLWFKAAPVIDVERTPNRLLLVSPPESTRVPEEGAEFRLAQFDAAAVRRSVRGEIRIVCSDDDPYNPAGARSTYAEPLGAPVDVIPGAGHITPADGYGRWPWVETWCTAAGVVS